MLNAAAGLGILTGGAITGGSSSGVSSLAAFRSYQNDPVGARKAYLERADTQADIERFKKNAKKLETVEDLLKDRKTLEFVLTSFGLESEINNVGKIRAVIESDPEDINSYANRLNDPRFGELATFFDLENSSGVAKLSQGLFQPDIIDNYLTNSFEKDLANQSPGLRDAVFFLRRANEVGNSLHILGDLALRSIVTTTLNLPPEIAKQSLAKQQSLIDNGVEIDKLSTTGSSSGIFGEIDVVNDDIDNILSVMEKANTAIGKLQGINDTLDELRESYAGISDIIDPAGVNAAEIAVQEVALPDLLRQKALVTGAQNAINDTDNLIDQLSTTFYAAYQSADATELADHQTTFQSLADQIATKIQNADFNGENLLLDGAADITTTVDTDGTQVITKFSDLNTFLTNISDANTAFQAVNFATLSTDLDAVEPDIDSAKTEFTPVDFQTELNNSALNYGIAQVDFATELNTQELSLGDTAIDDALDRIGTIRTALYEIRALARDAQEVGADLVEINTEYSSYVSQLSTAINTAGSVTGGDPETTINFDNLLTSGALTYNLVNTDDLTANGGTLDADIEAALVGSITAGNAATLESDVDSVYLTALDDLETDLLKDQAVFDFAVSDADPAGSLDQQILAYQTTLDGIIASAEIDGDNLLSPFENNQVTSIRSLGVSVTTNAATSFQDNFEDALTDYQHLILSGGSVTEKQDALNDLYFATNSSLGQLTSEKGELDIYDSALKAEREILEQGTSDGEGFLKLEQNTEYAIKFAERYLITLDSQSNGFGSNYNSDAALVGLVQNIGGGGSLNILA